MQQDNLVRASTAHLVLRRKRLVITIKLIQGASTARAIETEANTTG